MRNLIEFTERYLGVEFTEDQKEYIRKLDEKGRNSMKDYIAVNRKAEVGDYVKIVNASHTFGKYQNGDIFEVERVDSLGIETDAVKAEGNECGLIYADEYHVIIPVYFCDNCGSRLGESACSNSKGGSYCSVKCAGEEECSPDVQDESTPDISSRVTSLERIVGELVRNKSSLESQLLLAQSNIERQAQELEREKEYRVSIYTKLSDLKDEVESNTKDIAFLDERTYEKPGKPAKSAEEILREISKILERDERQ